ncbi:MAG: nucleoside monophosphate kinase [Candidatus Paceibacteria bacterium]
MHDGRRLFLFVGRPASGKETQARLLAEKLSAELFMTGARFREIIRSESLLGRRIKEEYDIGKLMPAWVAGFLFQEFLFNLPEEKHAVFEGTGRAPSEAELFDEVAAWLGRPYTVFNLEVSPETVLARSAKRERDAADKTEAVKTRLAEYDSLTAPAIEYFRKAGKVVDIDGEQPVEVIHEKIIKHVEELS